MSHYMVTYIPYVNVKSYLQVDIDIKMVIRWSYFLWN